jgi:hypothetical protein
MQSTQSVPELDDDPTPKPKKHVPTDMGPRDANMGIPEVIWSGSSTKICEPQQGGFPVKMTATEFLEKMARPTGGQVTTDNSKPKETRDSDYNEGMVEKVWNGAKEGDPQRGEKAKPKRVKLAPVRRNGKAKMPTNEGHSCEAKTPVKNASVMDFYAFILDKLAGSPLVPSNSGVMPPATNATGVPGLPKPSVPAPSVPGVPGIPGVPKVGSDASSLLYNLKLAAGGGDITGNRIGSTAGQSVGLGANVVKPQEAPEAPKGSSLPRKE